MPNAIAAGLGATLGIGSESTVGTGVSPTRWTTFSKHSMKRKNNTIQDQALHGGLYNLSQRRILASVTAGGGMELGVYDRGLGVLFQQMIGGVPSISSVAGRTVGDGVENSTTSLTSASAAFSAADVGKSISGSGIPAGTTIAAVTSATAVVMTAAASVNAASVTVAIGSGVYQQVYQPADVTGKSLTMQVGKPQTNGVLVPFTWRGVKVTDWTLDIKTGGFASLAMTLDAFDESITVAFSAPSYVTSNLFAFRQATLQLGGTVATNTAGVAVLTGAVTASAVTEVQIKGKLTLDTNRIFLGGGGIKSEQISNGWWEITGQISAEFANVTDLLSAFYADGAVAAELSFVGPPVAGPTTSALQVLVPSIRLNDAPPSVDGPGILKVSAPFTGLDDGINAPIQLIYNTLDSAA